MAYAFKYCVSLYCIHHLCCNFLLYFFSIFFFLIISINIHLTKTCLFYFVVYIEMGDQSKPTNLFASPPPIVRNTSTLLPSSKHHSAVWNDFRLNPNSKKTTICNYCSQKIKYYGTTSMAKHYKLCEKNPNWSIELEHASF